MESKKKFTHITPEQGKQIQDLYFRDEYSIYMINKLTGRAYKTIWQWVQKVGKPRTWAEAQILANKLGRGSGIKRSNWKGGRNKSGYGYWLIWVSPNDPFYCMANNVSLVREHRYLMAQHLGRPLSDNEIVHHINGIKTDNRFSNLALVSRSNHPTKSFMKALQKRIRELEAELSQQKLSI